MKLAVIITTLIYASSNVVSVTAANGHVNIEAFETMLLTTNTNPATCTHNCRCPLTNPACTLSECKSNCKCQTGACNMPKCTTNCKCQTGECNMPACTTNCKCQSGNCPMPACKKQCKCTLGGCFSSEQEEFLMAMEQDTGATAQISNQTPLLRGRPMPSAVPDQSNESLALLAQKYRLTAQALLKTASLVMDLSAVEDTASMEDAKDQVLRAAQLAESLGDDAADEADEVLSSTESIHHKSNFPGTADPKHTFYLARAPAPAQILPIGKNQRNKINI